MGLDMNPMAAPMPGFEAEFGALLRQLPGRTPPPRSNLLDRLLGRDQQHPDRETLITRFNEISVPPFSNLDAPIAGRDNEADDWIMARFSEGRFGETDASANEAISAMAGRHMIEALPDCDGFPVYSNGGLYEGVDRTSFRGSFLNDCQDCLSQEQMERAWVHMSAEELSAYASELSQSSARFARARGVEKVLGQREPPDAEENNDAAQAHIVDSLARWASFWSAKGHGSEPFF